MKRCSKCKEIKPRSEFNKKSEAKDGKSSQCRLCSIARGKAYRASETGQRNIREYRRTHKRTGPHKSHRPKEMREWYEIAIKEQNSKCAGCGITEEQFGMKLSIDHDHQTSMIRGLLCTNCNLVLGNAKDNIAILVNLIEYLKGYKKNPRNLRYKSWSRRL